MAILPLSVEHLEQIAYYLPRYQPNHYWSASNYTSVQRIPTKESMINTFLVRNIDLNKNHYVFWPDYSVSGRLDEIFNVFKNLGMVKVEVGLLNLMSDGQFGDKSSILPLSYETIARNSINLNNPEHRKLASKLPSLNIRELLHEQQRRMLRSNIGEELLYLPAKFGNLDFPGGYKVQQAKESFERKQNF